MKPPHPPDRLETEHLVLRCWTEGDAPLLAEALDAARADLETWIPWVLARSSPSELEERVEQYREDFYAGEDALYAVMDPDETTVLGGAGLYRRIGPGALEIGYWVRTDHAGRGIATEAARLLTDAGLDLPEIERIEIHCDPRNTASAVIPKKLGYVLRETVRGAVLEQSGERQDTMIWVREG